MIWGQHEAWYQEVTIKLPVLSDEHLSVAEFAVMQVRAILVQQCTVHAWNVEMRAVPFLQERGHTVLGQFLILTPSTQESKNKITAT